MPHRRMASFHEKVYIIHRIKRNHSLQSYAPYLFPAWLHTTKSYVNIYVWVYNRYAHLLDIHICVARCNGMWVTDFKDPIFHYFGGNFYKVYSAWSFLQSKSHWVLMQTRTHARTHTQCICIWEFLGLLAFSQNIIIITLENVPCITQRPE